MAAGLYSQSDYRQTIRGTVFDKQSQNPMPGANILLKDVTPVIGTTTDSKGEFILNDVSIGRHELEISFLGYSTISLSNLNLTSGKELVLKIELEENVVTTQTVVVTGTPRKDQTINKMATVSARSFSVEETERFAGSLGDPSRMVANYAGVMSTNDSRNDIVIRGNSPAGLLWRLEGIEIPNPNHFGAAGTTGGPVSMLNNNLLTNSDFFTSAFPAEYGNATSGVFDLKMRTGNNQKREYVGQIGFNGFELGAEGPFSKEKGSSYLANYRYSTLGVFNMMGIKVGVGEAIPQYQDLSFKMDFPRTKLGKFSVIGIGGLSYIKLHDSEKALLKENEDANYDFGGVDLDFGSDMGVIGVSNLYFFDENTRLQTNVSVLGSRMTTYIDSLLFDEEGAIIQNSNYEFYAANFSEVKYSASTTLKNKISSKDNYGIGLIFDIYDISYVDSVIDHNLPGGFRKTIDIDGNMSLLRGFIQWQHRFNDLLTLNSGIYSQFLDLTGEIVAEPRIGLKWSLNQTNSLNFGAGMHSRTIARQNYFLQTWQESGEYIETNKDVGLMKSLQAVMGYDKLFREDIRLKAEIYYQYLYNIPVCESFPEYSELNGGDSFSGMVLDSLVNEGTGKNYGFEITFEKFFSKNYYFLTTMSIFDSKYNGFDKKERNTAYNGKIVCNMLAGKEFKLGKHNSITIDFKTVFAGGKPYIPIDLEESIAENYTTYDWSQAFEKRHENYFRTDLRVGFRKNGKKVSQEWAVDLQNLTNNKNIFSQSFSPRTKSITSDYQTGFFPMMLYRINF